jgi:hypothetical protein
LNGAEREIRKPIKVGYMRWESLIKEKSIYYIEKHIIGVFFNTDFNFKVIYIHIKKSKNNATLLSPSHIFH